MGAEAFVAKQWYYQCAGKFLHDYKFQNEEEYIIWKHHSEGMGMYIIDKIINRKVGKARRVVERLKTIMLQMYSFEATNDL